MPVSSLQALYPAEKRGHITSRCISLVRDTLFHSVRFASPTQLGLLCRLQRVVLRHADVRGIAPIPGLAPSEQRRSNCVGKKVLLRQSLTYRKILQKSILKFFSIFFLGCGSRTRHHRGKRSYVGQA